MARIRTIKPEYFRHEGLQDLEIANPGAYVMLTFAGLWGHCDSKGRFEWRPRQLKLDILPFLAFDMGETLALLEQAGMVQRYTVDGKEYGLIPSFEKHQRITGKEATDGEKHPDPVRETPGKQQGNNMERQDAQEGKGREEEKEGKGKEEAPASPPPKPKKRATALPADFELTDAGVEYANARAINIPDELVRMRNWAESQGVTRADWQATWRTWCDKAVEFGRTKKGSPPGGRQGRIDTYAAEAAAARGVEHEPDDNAIPGTALRIA